jgi:hypothetical protein
MKLRASIPFAAFLEGEQTADLSPSTEFRYKGATVAVSFGGDDRINLTSKPETYFRRLRVLRIEIEEGESRLRVLAEAGNGWPLLKFLAGASNRVLRSARNFGMVAHLEELRVSDEESDRWLRALNVEVSEDGNKWRREPGRVADEPAFGARRTSREHVGI